MYSSLRGISHWVELVRMVFNLPQWAHRALAPQALARANLHRHVAGMHEGKVAQTILSHSIEGERKRSGKDGRREGMSHVLCIIYVY